MADWYVSSTKYATYTAFQTAHAYSVGDLIVPTSPTSQSKWVLRCTTAGTSAGSEPTWPVTNNGTVTSNTAVFTNVTGQSTYAWNAAAGDYNTLCRGTNTRVGPGDNIYISSDHSESVVTLTIGLNTGANTGYSLVKVLSVNKAGSTPPVAADLLAGASLAGQVIDANAYAPIYYYGITFNTNAANSWTGQSSSSNSKAMLFDTCTLYMSTSNAVSFSTSGSTAFPAPTFALLNSTVQLSGAGQYFGATAHQQYDFTNLTLTGTAPTNLFKSEGQGVIATVRGSDISSVTSNLTNTNNSSTDMKVLFEGCKIASGCTRYATTGIVTTRDEVELVNCFDGTHIISERYQPSGTLTTEFTTYLTAGAQDNVGHYSHKMVSTANCDKWVNTFNSFWMDLNYTTTGSSKTATVEISAASSLNTDDVSLWLEYEGTASSSLSSFANTLPATVLTSGSALTSSAAAWTSGAGTNMKLAITFTPQTAGRLRGQIRLGKASTTIYVNPQITVT